MAFESSEERAIAKQFVDIGMRYMQELQDARDGLKDTTKDYATKLNVKPAELSRYLKTAWKASIEKQKEDLQRTEEFLEAAGRV